MSTGSISFDALRALVDVDPDQALRAARARLVDEGAASDAATLWWIAGLAERLLGDTLRSRASLEEAVARARACDDRQLAARATISLAFDVDDVRLALAMLEAVEPDVAESDHAVLAIQRGLLEYRLGRLEAAVVALAMALDLTMEARDGLGELKVLVNLGAIESQRAEYDHAREHLLRAITIAFETDQISWGALALANLAFVETEEGNLPEALDAFASAEDGYRRTGTQSELPRLYANHAEALADANLLDDAEELIDRAVALSAASGNDLEHAELLLISAEIDLAKGKPDEAHVSAVDAVAAFTRQGRESWLHVAERLRLRAEARSDAGRTGDRRGTRDERPGARRRGLAVRRIVVDVARRAPLRRARPRRRRTRPPRGHRVGGQQGEGRGQGGAREGDGDARHPGR